MAHPLSDDQVLRLHLRAQHLAPQNCQATGVAQVVKAVCGVQAQDAAAAALSVRVRCAGLVATDVERALVQERTIVRTWCMRGTLHLIAAEDLGWLLAYLGPVFIRAGRGRRAELGLDDETAARAVLALRELLEESGPLAREEIVERLAARGIRLAGQARPHLLGLAALEGVICPGPNRGHEPTYVLISDWIDPGPARTPEEARAELAVRYLSAYAPAAPEDFAAWSGLPLGEARAAWRQIADRLIEVEAGEAPAWMLRSQREWLDELAPPPPVVRLLPGYDTYLLGYRSRDRILAPEHAKRIFPGGGLLRPALLVDGRVRGAWRVNRRRAGIDVIVKPFEDLGADVRLGLEAEVLDLAHFLGAPATLMVMTAG